MTSPGENVNAVEVVRSATELEATLKNLYQRKRNVIEDREIAVTRLKLRSLYTTILQSSLITCTSKDVEQSLWKNIYYKPIEEFRRRLRAFQLNQPASTKSAARPIEFSRILSAFRSFLQEASGFYGQLIVTLAGLHGVREVEPLVRRFGWGGLVCEVNGVEREQQRRALQTIHKLLIFLGDLARYKELYAAADRAEKKPNWVTATEYYNAAREIVPESGNPWNQLAVIATYRNSGTGGEWEGVYFYYRSLVIANPFLTARENLALLFQKTIKRAASASTASATSEPASQALETPSEAISERSTGKSGRNSKKAARERPRVTNGERTKAEKWLGNFVRMHAALFLKDGLDTIPNLKSALLEPLPSLLSACSLDSDTLLRMTIINQSALFVLRHSGSSKDKSITSSLDKVSWEREALTFTLEFFLALVEVVEATVHETELLHLKSVDAAGPVAVIDLLSPPVRSVLPALRVSLKWLFLSVDDLDQFDMDSEVTSKLWSSLEVVVKFFNRILHIAGKAEDGKDRELVVLREDMELRGFLALKGEIGVKTSNGTRTPLRLAINPVKETEKRMRDLVKDGARIFELRREKDISAEARVTEECLVANWDLVTSNRNNLRDDVDLELEETLRIAQLGFHDDSDNFGDEVVVYQAPLQRAISPPPVSQPQPQQHRTGSISDPGRVVGSGRPSVFPSKTLSSDSIKSTSSVAAEQTFGGSRRTSHVTDDGLSPKHENFYTLFVPGGSGSAISKTGTLFRPTRATSGADIWERGDSRGPFGSGVAKSGLSVNGTATMTKSTSTMANGTSATGNGNNAPTISNSGRMFDLPDLARTHQEPPSSVWPHDHNSMSQSINPSGWRPNIELPSNHFNGLSPPPGLASAFHHSSPANSVAATNGFPLGLPPPGFSPAYKSFDQPSSGFGYFPIESPLTAEFPDKPLFGLSRRQSQPLPQTTHETFWPPPNMSLFGIEHDNLLAKTASSSSSSAPSSAKFLVGGGTGRWGGESVS